MTTRSTPSDGREFVRMSVDIARHPKILAMGDPAAAWGYAAALAYCGQYKTDGWITVRTIAHEAGISTQKARKLVAAGLVHEHGHACEKCPEIPKGKAYLHDYLEHNRSRDEVDESRRSKAEAGKKGAAKRWGNLTPKPPENGHGTCHSTSQGTTHATSDGTCMAEEEKEERTTHPGKTRSESNARENERPAEPPEPIPAGPGATGPNATLAWAAVRATTPPGTPNAVRGQLARQAQLLLDEGQPGTRVTAALLRLHGTPGAGPGLLPNMLADLQKEQANGTAYGVRLSRAAVSRPSTTDQRIADAMALKERMRAAGAFDNDPDPALDRRALRALPGAAS